MDIAGRKASAEHAQPQVEPAASSAGVKLALLAGAAIVLGLLAWSWMAFADSIYLTRLAAIVASCL